MFTLIENEHFNTDFFCLKVKDILEFLNRVKAIFFQEICLSFEQVCPKIMSNMNIYTKYGSF